LVQTIISGIFFMALSSEEMKTFARAKKELQGEGNKKPTFKEILTRMTALKTANCSKGSGPRKSPGKVTPWTSVRAKLKQMSEDQPLSDAAKVMSGVKKTSACSLNTPLKTAGELKDRLSSLVSDEEKQKLQQFASGSAGTLALGAGGAGLGMLLGRRLGGGVEQMPDANTSAAQQMYRQRNEERRRKRYGIGGGVAGALLLP
jgi:hypothetical protein